jgi:hypothetical protein
MHLKIGFGLGLTALLVTTASAVPTLASAAVPAAPSGTAAPCTPSTSKIGGGPATTYCGPATATLKVKGKTYRFKGGYCQTLPALGNETDITLGTFLKGRGGSGTIDNGKNPYFRLDLGPGQSSLLALTYFGGTLLPATGPVGWHGSATSKGTFKSLSAVPARFSGTFDCHGVFVSG